MAQTCTPDQHLITRTQVCLKSNLKKISQDTKTLWRQSRSTQTHTCTHLVWITGVLQRCIVSEYPRGETPPLWVLGWLLSFICTGYRKSLICVCTYVRVSVQEIGSEASHMRNIMIHLNAMCSLKNVFQFARDKNNSIHLVENIM